MSYGTGVWFGGTAGPLVTLGVLTAFAAGCSATGRQLAYDSGDRPVKQTLSYGGKFADPVYAYVWDVRRSMDSTFSVPDGFGTGDAKLLSRRLRISVPTGCADRTVHRRLTADGEHRIGRGSTQWLRRYDAAPRPRPHGLRPTTVALEAWWNGGDGDCPSISLTCRDPKLHFEAGPDFVDADFCP